MKICMCILLEDHETDFDEKFGEHLKEVLAKKIAEVVQEAAVSYVENITSKKVKPLSIPKASHIQVMVNGPVRNEQAVRAFDNDLGGEDFVEKLKKQKTRPSEFPFQKLKKEFDWPN